MWNTILRYAPPELLLGIAAQYLQENADKIRFSERIVPIVQKIRGVCDVILSVGAQSKAQG